jgi:pyruvate/2-oxoglutarate dehydrogenase complex dihydrolipoamide acyltransferase (E2) component
VPNHPGLFLVLYGVVAGLVAVGELLAVGELVAVGEVLADADALAVGDVLWVGVCVGVADFTGGELTTGLNDRVGCAVTTLGLGDVLRRWLALGEGVVLAELRCCAVFPVVLSAWPVMWPDRYRPTATAAAHKTAVAPAGTSQRRRVSAPEPLCPRPGPPRGPPGAASDAASPSSAPVAAAGMSALVAPA